MACPRIAGLTLGRLLYDLIPNMPEPRLRPLIDRFIEYISQSIALAPLLSFE